jgi:hypothetical protein
MIRFLAAILLSTLVMQTPVNSQQPTPSLPSDYVLVTFVLRHDQSRNLDRAECLESFPYRDISNLRLPRNCSQPEGKGASQMRFAVAVADASCRRSDVDPV